MGHKVGKVQRDADAHPHALISSSVLLVCLPPYMILTTVTVVQLTQFPFGVVWAGGYSVPVVS